MVNQLLQLAYALYPKGIPDRENLYSERKEAKNLLKIMEQKPVMIYKLEQIGASISTKSSEYNFENLSGILTTDRCVKARFYFADKSIPDIFLYISIVIPFYILYQHKPNQTPQKVQDLNDSNLYLSDVTGKNIVFKDKIISLTETLFPDYQPFPAEHLNTEVDDIVFNGNGRLLSFHASEYTTPMTFFNAFFSDTYF